MQMTTVQVLVLVQVLVQVPVLVPLLVLVAAVVAPAAWSMGMIALHDRRMARPSGDVRWLASKKRKIYAPGKTKMRDGKRHRTLTGGGREAYGCKIALPGTDVRLVSGRMSVNSGEPHRTQLPFRSAPTRVKAGRGLFFGGCACCDWRGWQGKSDGGEETKKKSLRERMDSDQKEKRNPSKKSRKKNQASPPRTIPCYPLCYKARKLLPMSAPSFPIAHSGISRAITTFWVDRPRSGRAD